MNSIQNIQERFSIAGIPVAGLGYFRDYQNTRQVAVPDSEGEWQGVSLNEDYIGYIRAADRITYTQDGFIGCDTRMYDVQQDCVLVLWHSRDQNQRQVIDLAFRALGDVLLQNMSTDRQRILSDEVLPENDLGLIRIAFRIEYKYVGNSCPIDLCTGYFEPCFDTPSCPAPLPVDLCEQVAECLPDFISDDEGNGLTLGEDGKLYVAESGGGGLTCEDLGDCQVIQDIEEALDGKANTSDLAAVALSGAYADLSGTPTLATVATTGSYNDLTDKPTIPTVPTLVSAFTNDANYQSGAQVAASLLPLLPLVSYYGDAGHTGNTDETPVLTFAIQPGQWRNAAMYQIITDLTRAAGTVTYRLYLNTSATIGGVKLLDFTGTAANINLFRHFSVDGNNIRHNANTAAQVSDIGATANVSMTDGSLNRTGVVHLVVTIQGAATTSNGAFKNIQIGLV
jgi:hypothetical protein